MGSFMKHKLGFTLIELVIVIVILGILAVIAAPKFMQIQSDARKADLQQLAATLKSSIATVNAKAMIEGKETALASTVDGISIANGYPIASNMGIVKTLQTPKEWYITNPKFSGTSIDTTVFSLYDIKNPTDLLKSSCYVMYYYSPVVDLKPSKDNGRQPGNSSSIINWIKSKIINKIVCPILNLPSIDIAKTLPICPQYPEPERHKMPNGTIQPPVIRVVDSKC